jgi:drug/metabolite transporter (DMT)-like permease
MEIVMKYLPYLIPVLVIQLVLMLMALLDLLRREKTRGPKWLWALIILFGEILGPIIYLVFGRVDES